MKWTTPTPAYVTFSLFGLKLSQVIPVLARCWSLERCPKPLSWVQKAFNWDTELWIELGHWAGTQSYGFVLGSLTPGPGSLCLCSSFNFGDLSAQFCRTFCSCRGRLGLVCVTAINRLCHALLLRGNPHTKAQEQLRNQLPPLLQGKHQASATLHIPQAENCLIMWHLLLAFWAVETIYTISFLLSQYHISIKIIATDTTEAQSVLRKSRKGDLWYKLCVKM